jgi:PAS domain S-box-containing protein
MEKRVVVDNNMEVAGKASGRPASDFDQLRSILSQKFLESPMQLASIINSAMDAIITADASQRIMLFNASAEKMFGCPASEAIGQPLDKFIPERFRAAHQHHIPNFGDTNATKRSMGALGKVFGLRTNGEEFPIEASISHTESAGEKFYTVIIRDISQRERDEERLREQAALLDHARDAIMVHDLDDQILFWNKSAERLYGWTAPQAIGKKIHELIYQGLTSRFAEAKKTLLEKGEWIGEVRQHNTEMKELVVEGHWTLVRDENGLPKSIMAINTDVTEKKKLEAQFLRAHRMEGIGTLAGGIAHDLNNLLSPILLSIQLLQMRHPDDQTQQLLKTLRVNAERGSDLIKQVLAFARGMEGERIALQPKHIVREIVKVLKDTLPKSIDIVLALPEKKELWNIKGDATQVHQVLMNLCVNARDAMPDGGKLSITLENRVIDETYARTHLEAKPGRYVVITVEDSGVGIPASQIDKIFEPFFTTKEQGKGTGLGLSTVLAIIKSHGGFVDVYSELGKGTKFRMSFPAIDSGSVDQAVEASPELPHGHGELILVVDDEEGIREVTRGTLQAFGYSVLTANDGTEAVVIFAQNKDQIKLVLTDMMMPYMDGAAAIRALRKIDPQVKVIASSGLTDNVKNFEANELNVKAFLVKPYSAERLLTTIADILKA